MGKKLVAGRDLPAGHVLTADDIAMKAPGDALFPFHLDDFIGRRLGTAISTDQALVSFLAALRTMNISDSRSLASDNSCQPQR